MLNNKKVSWILFCCVVIPILFWSTQMWVNPNPFISKGCNGPPTKEKKLTDTKKGILKDRSDFLYHYQDDIEDTIHTKEGLFKWIFTSGVCPLGKISFYFTIIIFLAFLLCATYLDKDKWEKQQHIWKYILILLTSLGSVIALALNPPLFIRTLPVIVTLYIIIFLNT